MASNFRITSRRKGRSLYLTISGDFDGTSAMELIYTLKDINGIAETIYIETEGLSKVFPFGLEVFQKHFCDSALTSRKLIFSGNPGCRIAPQEASCIERRES